MEATTPTGSRRIMLVWPGRYSPLADPLVSQTARQPASNPSAWDTTAEPSAAACAVKPLISTAR